VPLLVVLLLGLLQAAAPADFAGCGTPPFRTRAGLVCGRSLQVDGTQVNAFLGIPYAEDTGGENRWKAPLPRAAWPGVLHALQPGAICPQNRWPWSTQDGSSAGQSEDCLSLSLWAPAAAEPGSLPVLVFVHGGSFQTGSLSAHWLEQGGWHLYDGSFLAGSQDLVVVTLNYRLGALGFLAGTAGLEGNYGLLDQQLALQWVQDNISVFGGDPGRVTLAGESAGAMSVGLHLFSAPGSAGLFGNVIMESNPLGVPFPDLETASFMGDAYLLAVGCLLRADQLACLRRQPLEKLLEKQEHPLLKTGVLDRGPGGLLTWLPVIDGSVLLRQPMEAALQEGASLPLIIGNNSDEGTLFVELFLAEPLAGWAYGTILTLLFGKDGAALVGRAYPMGRSADAREPLMRVMHDYAFHCPARALAAAAGSGAFVYEFSHNPSFEVVPGSGRCSDRSCHMDELSSVCGTRRPEQGFSSEERRLSDQMMDYWAGFAALRHHPAARQGEAPAWQPFRGRAGNVLQLGMPITNEASDQERCELWDGLGYPP
jgi:carboxylesterase type B